MPTEPDPIIVYDVVNRAVDVVDPDRADDDVADFLERFEDADEPIQGIPDIGERFAEAAGARDPEGENPALQMAVAVATYLAFRRDELDDDPEDILRLAARAEFDGNPPELIADWLAQTGVDV
jgi:hypothetical protein